MPNWVYNTVTIEGEPDEITELMSVMSEPRPDWKIDETAEHPFTTAEGEWVIPEQSTREFSFWNVVQPPADKWPLYFTTSGWKAGERVGDTAWNWYEWNTAYWGTKWDAGTVQVEQFSDTEVRYLFETAWDYPSKFMKAFSERFSNLSIIWEWEEEQGFGGTIDLSYGEWNVSNEYDAPASHSDYKERGKEDECQCAYTPDESAWYEDCPRDSANSQVGLGELTQEGTPA